MWFCLLVLRWENAISGCIPSNTLGQQGASSVFSWTVSINPKRPRSVREFEVAIEGGVYVCRVVSTYLSAFRWENVISRFMPSGKLGRQGASSVFPMHHIYKSKRDIKCARAPIKSILADRTIPSALYLARLVLLWLSWLASKYYTRFGKMQFLTITP